MVLGNLIIYGSANMPEADGVTIGGAVDFTKRVQFADLPYAGLTTTDTLDVVSSSASDVGVKVQVAGRDGTGTIQTPAAITVNGTAVESSTFGGQGFQRLLYGVTTGGSVGSLSNPGGTAAVGDIAVMSHTKIVTSHTVGGTCSNTSGATPPLMHLQAGDGATLAGLVYQGLAVIIRIKTGTGAGQLRMVASPYVAGAYGADIVAINRDWTQIPDGTSVYDLQYGFLFDILPNPVSAITRLFATSQADVPGGSNRTFYEKIFWVNTNASTALQSAQAQIVSESGALPSGALLDLALTKVLNDTQTDANRQTLPTNGDSTALTFVTQPSPINIIASPGTLPNGNSASVAQAGWLRLTLPAGTSVYQGAADLRMTGSTT